MFRQYLRYCVVVFMGWGTLYASAPSPLGEKDRVSVVSRVQEQYDRMKALSATFSQTYLGKLGQSEKSSGTLLLEKPGKMKWDYQTPKGKLLVSDGQQMMLYDPETKQAMLQPQPTGKSIPMVASLLLGGVQLKDAFEVLEAFKEGKDIHLQLKPKEATPNVRELHLKITEGSAIYISELRILDDLGGENTLRFSKVRFKETLGAKTFVVAAPKGAVMVTSGPGL